jgi:hypothetical protein
MGRKVCNFSKALSHVYFIRGCTLCPELKPAHVSHAEGDYWYASCPASCFTEKEVVETCDTAQLRNKKAFLVEEEELDKIDKTYGGAYQPAKIPESIKPNTPQYKNAAEQKPEPTGGLLNYGGEQKNEPQKTEPEKKKPTNFDYDEESDEDIVEEE